MHDMCDLLIHHKEKVEIDAATKTTCNLVKLHVRILANLVTSSALRYTCMLL